MTECSSCGAELNNYETRCPVCGKPTAHYHRQKRCLHCGAPVAQKAKTCLMCGKPADSLPLNASFSGSWLGIVLGVLIIVGLVMWINSYQQPDLSAQAAQTTILPTFTATLARPVISTATPSPAPTLAPTVAPTPTPRTHTVERGQTLFYIAQQYHVSVDDIVALNNLPDSRILRVGQVLLIPADAIPPADSTNQLPPQIVHVIQSGETLLGLAEHYDTTLDAIMAANPKINPDLIYEGQEVIIPLAMPTSTPTPTPAPTATATPGPRYIAPDLLSPANGQTSPLSEWWFNWTATGFLADNEFYVLQLTWPDGSSTQYWTKSTSWSAPVKPRTPSGPVRWSVSIMRQTGVNAAGAPVGVSLAAPREQRVVNWPQ